MPKNRSNLAVSSQNMPIQSASLWISANAGSGKTYRLTRQVVKLMLLGVPPERICCITYTKAAASEMRARVIKSLRELLLAGVDARKAMIEDILEQPASDAIMARAPLLFGTVLDSVSGGLQLTTIHGFCQQLLRAFPLEAGVAPHFTVADDMQTANLTAQVKHRLLSGASAISGALAESIALIAERVGEQSFDALVKTVLNDRERWREAWAGQSQESYREKIYAALEVDDGASEQQFIKLALNCLNEDQKKILRGELPALQSEKAAYKQKFATIMAQWLERGVFIHDWLDIFLTQKFTPRADMQKTLFAPGSPLGDVVAHCIATAERFIESRAALALAEESYALAMIARQLLVLYDQLKDERSLLDYDDLISKTRELLSTGTMVGWVMSKLDHRIDHLLVDEAQDTSAEQWRIVRALVDELVATGGGEGSAGIPRSLFVVGDEKQSIFSFQGAAPELYAAMHSNFKQLLEHSPAPLRQEELIQSYRSAPAIMRVVDQVAAADGVRQALSASANPQSHIAKPSITGRVVLYAPVSGEDGVEHQPFTIPTEYQVARSGHQLLAEAICAQVQALLAQGWQPADMLVLVRSRGNLVLPLLRTLQRGNVPVAGMDRLVLSNHLAVKDILALLRFILTPGDDLALAQVLRSPLVGVSEQELYDMAHGHGALMLWQQLQQRAPTIAAKLDSWRQRAHLRPYDFLTQLLEVDGARIHFAQRFGAEIHEILDELKEQAAHMPASMAATQANFISFISESDRQIKREMEESNLNQLRVMTVHGAKGLEAPLVIIADAISVPDAKRELFCEAGDNPPLPICAISDDASFSRRWAEGRDELKRSTIAEYHRLLYVALTRAKQELHMFGIQPKNRKEPAPESWYAHTKTAMLALGAQKGSDESLSITDANYQPLPGLGYQDASANDLPGWATSAAPTASKKATLSPSKLAREALAPFIVKRGQGAKERGVRLHRVLQFMQADTTPAQLEKLIAHLAPDWSEADQAHATEEVWNLFSTHRWLWDNPSKAEVNIAGTLAVNGASYPVIGQIDRLVDTAEAMVVIDYKTGRDIPESGEAVSDSYLLQMKLYVALLETLYPGRVIRPAILWSAGPALMWLDDAVKSIPWSRAAIA
jgi:ATP-dependent helicase/nuclease subunit A